MEVLLSRPGFPGIKIIHSNNSKLIFASATSGSSIRGLSINVLFLDEFAFVENDSQFQSSIHQHVRSPPSGQKRNRKKVFF